MKKLAAPAIAAGIALAIGATLAASASQFTVNGAVTRAEFDHLQSQVQDLEKRVSALEHGRG